MMRFAACAIFAVALAGASSAATAQQFSPDAVAPTYADNQKAIQAGQMQVYQGPGAQANSVQYSLVVPTPALQSPTPQDAANSLPAAAAPALVKLNPPASN